MIGLKIGKKGDVEVTELTFRPQQALEAVESSIRNHKPGGYSCDLICCVPQKTYSYSY